MKRSLLDNFETTTNFSSTKTTPTESPIKKFSNITNNSTFNIFKQVTSKNITTKQIKITTESIHPPIINETLVTTRAPEEVIRTNNLKEISDSRESIKPTTNIRDSGEEKRQTKIVGAFMKPDQVQLKKKCSSLTSILLRSNQELK
ncbi:hypothetical protein QTP88_001017 [Uroleucon formosanum]